MQGAPTSISFSSQMTYKSSPYLDVKSISLCCLQGCTLLRRIYGLQKSGFTIGHYAATRHPGIATVEIGLIASGRDTDRTRIASKHMDRLALAHPSLLCTEIASGEPHSIL
jgi:hypothetical protein